MDSNRFLRERQALNDRLTESRGRIATRAAGFSATRYVVPLLRIAVGDLASTFVRRGGPRLTLVAALPWILRFLGGHLAKTSQTQSVFQKVGDIFLRLFRPK